MRWLAVRVVAWGLRGGVSDDHVERVLRERFPWRDADWRWDVIGDAHIRNGQREVRDNYRAWQKTQPAVFEHPDIGICNKGRRHNPPCDYGNGI